MNYGVDTGFLVALELPEHPEHASARSVLKELVSRGDRLSLAP